MLRNPVLCFPLSLQEARPREITFRAIRAVSRLSFSSYFIVKCVHLSLSLTYTHTHTHTACWLGVEGSSEAHPKDKRSANRVVLKLCSKEPYRGRLRGLWGDPSAHNNSTALHLYMEVPCKISFEQVLWLNRTPGQQLS